VIHQPPTTDGEQRLTPHSTTEEPHSSRPAEHLAQPSFNQDHLPLNNIVPSPLFFGPYLYGNFPIASPYGTFPHIAHPPNIRPVLHFPVPYLLPQGDQIKAHHERLLFHLSCACRQHQTQFLTHLALDYVRQARRIQDRRDSAVLNHPEDPTVAQTIDAEFIQLVTQTSQSLDAHLENLRRTSQPSNSPNDALPRASTVGPSTSVSTTVQALTKSPSLNFDTANALPLDAPGSNHASTSNGEAVLNETVTSREDNGQTGSNRFTSQQIFILEGWYAEHIAWPYLNNTHLVQLIEKTGLPAHKLKKWLNNRRTRDGNSKKPRKNSHPYKRK